MDESQIPENPGELLDEFAERHWKLAARHAWRMYHERGRGAVVWRSNVDGKRSRKLPLNYLTFRGPKEEVMGTELEIVRHLIDTYDPEKEAVLAINFRDGTTVVDVYEKEPPPPDCAEQNGDADHEYDIQRPHQGPNDPPSMYGDPEEDLSDGPSGTPAEDFVAKDDMIDTPGEIDTPDGPRGDGATGPTDFDDDGPSGGPGGGPGGGGDDDDDMPDLPDFMGDDPDGGALA